MFIVNFSQRVKILSSLMLTSKTSEICKRIFSVDFESYQLHEPLRLNTQKRLIFDQKSQKYN